MTLYGVHAAPNEEPKGGTLRAGLASARPSPEREQRYREQLRQADARLANATTPGAIAAARRERDDVYTSGAWLRKAGMR